MGLLFYVCVTCQVLGGLQAAGLHMTLVPRTTVVLEQSPQSYRSSGHALGIGRVSERSKSRVLLEFALSGVQETINFHKGLGYMSHVAKADLVLHCINLTDSYKSRNYYWRGDLDPVEGHVFLYITKVLKEWGRGATWQDRYPGEPWAVPYLDLRGKDAAYPDLRIEVPTCTTITVPLEEIMSAWMSGRSVNHGLVLALEHDGSSHTGLLQLADSSHPDPNLHIRLNLIIDETPEGSCGAGYQCGDSNQCINQTQVCNFEADCKNHHDESSCSAACDFDLDEQDLACEAWNLPRASDGKAGFNITSYYKLDRQGRIMGERGPSLRHDSVSLISAPTQDYSTESQSGGYALFSNSEHEAGTTAEVVSPWYEGGSGRFCRVHFSHYMYGLNVGLLSIFINTRQGLLQQLTQILPNNTHNWTREAVDVGSVNEAFRLVFRATRDVGDEGFIALDAIRLLNCSSDGEDEAKCGVREFLCPSSQVCISRDRLCDLNPDCPVGQEDEDPKLCDEVPRLGRCSFEQGLCGWRNVSEVPSGLLGVGPSSAVYNWTLHRGKSPYEHSGPSQDHTTTTEMGHYMVTDYEMKDGVGLTFLVESPEYPPPPAQININDSFYYQSCRVRFYHYLRGNHIQWLAVYFKEIPNALTCDGDSCKPRTTLLGKIECKDHGKHAWLRASYAIPPTYNRYQIIFEAKFGLRAIAVVALDDFSMSRECFGLDLPDSLCPVNTSLANLTSSVSPASRCCARLHSDYCAGTVTVGEVITQTINGSFRYSFHTCANTGSKGPTQYQCDSYYKPELKVKVVQNGSLAGAQVWKVPETNLYSITALGASGGTGVQNPKASMGGYVNAKFNLTKGEEIYMLVGQQGESACSQTTTKNPKTEKICRHGVQIMESATDNSSQLVVGGGGGGGGTFVFKYVKREDDTGEFIPLIVAGGGGGKSYYTGHEPIRADGGLSPPGSGNNAHTPADGPGGGAGWLGIIGGNVSVGGSPCLLAVEHFQWEISGGFGGGGGGCKAGGGGGGYSGGNVSLTNDKEHNGQGGSSYISALGMTPVYEPATQTGEGEVEIAMVLPCPCEFMCIYQNYHENKFKCYCQPNSILAEDGLHCLDPNELKRQSRVPEKLKTGTLIAIIVSGLTFVIFIIACLIYAGKAVKRKHTQKQLKAMGLEVLSRTDYQLDRLRGQGMVTEYNPNYDFGGTKCTLQDLREIPRERLTLIKALGQGAFGEVYQGYLTNCPQDGDLPVAVKTLPALCTDQAEMDFLMEALIMSKFNHPNIVRFMGVCFEKHPRFIILELLEGGDLKSFLREARPKPEYPSKVTMLDLVKLSLDVAKGCQYLEENHFIHRDIAARNCLLTTKGADRVAKIADFGMARDIYRADYYRKGGKAMLPVKWMPPEAFLDGIFTSKTDTWSFGILLWEVFSLGYMPYPGRGNQEVMQLVTAGGRLEPPQNCPTPVYHVMTMCWHGIPERRPNFGVIIEHLYRCVQDPEVTHSPLPVFHRPPSYERDATIMRPKDPDRMVLTVEPPRRYLEPDSPNSTDQLIGPQSPDLDQLHKTPQPSASKEDTKPKPFFKKMFDYDLGVKPVTNRAAGEKRDVGSADTDQPTENDALIPQSTATTKPEITPQATKSSSQNSLKDSHSSSSNNDSGKSSLENLSSQGDSPSGSNLGISSSPACPPSRASQHQAAAAIAAANIARSRPHPKRPFKENISLERGAPSVSKPNKDSSNAQQTSGVNSADRNSWPASQPYENVPVTSSSGSSSDSAPQSSPPAAPASPAAASSPECDNNKDPGDSGVVIDLKNGSMLGKVERSNQNWL